MKDRKRSSERRVAENGRRTRDERIKTLFDKAPLALFECDTKGVISLENALFIEISGFSEDEVLGMNVADLTEAGPQREGVIAFLEYLVREQPEPTPYFASKTLEDGRRVDVRVDWIYKRDEEGELDGLICFESDISDRKQAEDALKIRVRQQAIVAELGRLALTGGELSALMSTLGERLAEALDVKYTMVLELLPSGSSMLLKAGVGWEDGLVGCAEVSTSPNSQAGYTLQSRKSIVVADFGEESRFSEPALLREHGVVSGVSTIIESREGAWGVLAVHTDQHRHFTEDDVNFLQAVANLLADAITRKEMEEELHRFKLISDHSSDAHFLIDENARFLYVNRVACEKLGYSEDELLRLSVPDVDLIFNHTKFRDLLETIHESAIPPFESVNLRKDGETFPSEIVATGIQLQGKPYAFAVLRDISERKQAETHLKEWKDRYEAAIQASGDIPYDWDSKTNEVVYGSNLEEVLGYTQEDMNGGPTNWIGLIHPDDRPSFSVSIADILETREPGCLEYRVRKKNGETIFVEDRGQFLIDAENNLVRMVGFVRDISDRKQTEEEQRELERRVMDAQKLESLGVLAGGVAHDFNNLLVGILGNASIVLNDFEPSGELREIVTSIEVASGRAAELCHQMLAYSGKGKFLVEPVDLNLVVREMGKLIDTAVSKKIEIVYRFHDALASIEADRMQLRQVMMNLATNASEAIGDGTGVITITTGMMNCDRAYLQRKRLVEDAVEGEYVFLEVSDTGCGMNEATVQKLYDPFFTTKFTGRGLGMSAVLGIIRGHGGAIDIQSVPGVGTTCKVLFPAVEAPPESIPVEPPTKEESRRGGTVLLVDDDESVIKVGKRILERRGFDVIIAKDGVEATQCFRERADEIDCVILDLTMPRMSGVETFQELCRIQQDVRVIISSGYDEDEIIEQFEGKRPAGFLSKPYRMENLLEKVWSVLGD